MIRRGAGLLLVLSLLVLAPQCNLSGAARGSSTPPLPIPPSGPALPMALLSPTTGELATFGRILRNGSVLAFDEWNSRGGVLGRRIEWTVYEADCNFKTAGQATQQAIADGFQFIIGPLCSEAAIAAAQVAGTDTALMMAPTATHPLVTRDEHGQTRPTVFRASYAYPLQAQAMARFAFDTLEIRQAAVLFESGDDYSAALVDTFINQFTAQGGEIVYRAAYAPADSNFTQTLQAVGNARAEAIYLPAAASVINRVAGQLNQLRQSSPAELILLGSDSWSSPALDLAATSGSYFTTHFFLEDERQLTRQWADAYKAAYAVEPDTLAALGYDAAIILAEAIQEAGTFEVERVAKSLEQGRFAGVTGPITFDSQHNPLKPVPVVQIKDGRLIFAGYVNMHNENR